MVYQNVINTNCDYHQTEYVYINDYASPRELRLGIAEYIEMYNSQRPRQSLDYDTPQAVYESVIALPLVA